MRFARDQGNGRRRLRFVARADLERHVMLPDRGLAAAAAVTGDFHHGKVVVVVECEERHLEVALVEASAERQSEHADAKALGALAVGHPQHHMPQRPDLLVCPSPIGLNDAF